MAAKAVGNGALPEPRASGLVVTPYRASTPYSNHELVARPFGLTVPLRVASEAVMAVAASVVTVGPGGR